MVLTARGERIDIPRFGYRVTRLSHHVYELNVLWVPTPPGG